MLIKDFTFVTQLMNYNLIFCVKFQDNLRLVWLSIDKTMYQYE
jgi:hypothetical protein